MTVAITDTALLTALINGRPSVTVTDAAGRVVGTFTPEPLVPWDPTITAEELDRRANGPGLTFEEMKKRLGWE